LMSVKCIGRVKNSLSDEEERNKLVAVCERFCRLRRRKGLGK
jgi:hypothetical protein